jgi:carboxyl-terminal processing protease
MKNSAEKFFLTGFAGILLFFGQTDGASALFSDVPADHPQAQAIQILELRKVISGYSDRTFKPDQLITRAEFLKMAFSDVGYRRAPQEDITPFADVPADSWIAPYVKKALEINLISATGLDPKFNPAGAVTRVEAIKTAFPLSGIAAPYYTDIDPAELFPDVRPTAWYAYLARAAKLNGIVTVKNPEMFWAKHLMTRGDAAELLYQMQSQREMTEGGYGSVISGTGGEFEIDAVSWQLLNNPKFGILLDVWKKANTEFYGSSGVNQDELVYGAIKGLVDRLGDQYTVFEEPSDALGLQEYLEGEFEGIGTVIDVIDDKVVILKVFPASPAEKANLQTGDVIEKINNQSLAEMTINEALDLIRGDAGTSVHLTIKRNTQTLEVDLVRAKITIASATGKMMGTIAYVSVSEFTLNSPTEFTNLLNELNQQSPKGYVLDLRGNPGGYLDSAIQMLGHFIESDKTVVSTKTADGAVRTFHTGGSAELKGKPLIVIVNEGTASAGEIMAAAIQDYAIGKLLGVTTYGKGSVQEITTYSDDSLLKISIAHWLTPHGRDINGIGLTPDYTVELNENELLKGIDTQLNRAVELLNAGM